MMLARGLKEKAETSSWEVIAITDPFVGQWWEEMKADGFVDPREDILDHMKRSMKSKRGYNYKTALEHGVRPLYRDPSDYLRLHWEGRSPVTGEILKGEDHQTRALSEED
jgi:hypothetical protein